MSVKRKLKGNKEHKDRLFNYIFGSEENRKWTLQLYNAVNKSNYKDASLIELGQMMNPPVGKSGVNHRFRRISAIAESIRNENQEGN